jgi:hypothetical protein
MTAPRVCRACGASLTGDVRWCLRCYEPARELTPRAAVWKPGTFVDAPTVRGPSVPHWSRWDKTSTTFGPIGRVAWTGVVVSFLLSALTRSPFMLLFELPAAAVILHGIWARGWVVPSEPANAARLRDAIPDDPASSWLRDSGDIKHTVWLTLAGLLLMGTVMYGPLIMKFAAIAIAVVVSCFVFFRGALGRS